MLFHITSTHSEDNCPGYHTEKIPAVLEGLTKRDEIARAHNVKVHWFLSAAPDHTFYYLLEADKQINIDLFVTEVAPFPQAHKVTPVVTAAELVELARELMAQAQR